MRARRRRVGGLPVRAGAPRRPALKDRQPQAHHARTSRVPRGARTKPNPPPARATSSSSGSPPAHTRVRTCGACDPLRAGSGFKCSASRMDCDYVRPRRSIGPAPGGGSQSRTATERSVPGSPAGSLGREIRGNFLVPCPRNHFALSVTNPVADSVVGRAGPSPAEAVERPHAQLQHLGNFRRAKELIVLHGLSFFRLAVAPERRGRRRSTRRATIPVGATSVSPRPAQVVAVAGLVTRTLHHGSTSPDTPRREHPVARPGMDAYRRRSAGRSGFRPLGASGVQALDVSELFVACAYYLSLGWWFFRLRRSSSAIATRRSRAGRTRDEGSWAGPAASLAATRVGRNHSGQTGGRRQLRDRPVCAPVRRDALRPGPLPERPLPTHPNSRRRRAATGNPGHPLASRRPRRQRTPGDGN